MNPVLRAAKGKTTRPKAGAYSAKEQARKYSSASAAAALAAAIRRIAGK